MRLMPAENRSAVVVFINSGVVSFGWPGHTNVSLEMVFLANRCPAEEANLKKS